MAKNPEAIKAAEAVIQSYCFDHDEYEQTVTQRNIMYAVVQEEHRAQVARIHVPEMIRPHKVVLQMNEVLFLWFLNGQTTNLKNVGVYWYLQYRLYDYQECIHRLFDGGYLTVAAPADSLQHLKAENLKSILAAESLPLSGTKAQLIKRIKSGVPGELINMKYPLYQTFACTPAGIKVLDQADAIIYFHRNRMKFGHLMSFSEVEERASRFPFQSGQAVVCSLAAIKDQSAFLESIALLSSSQRAELFSRIYSRIKLPKDSRP